VRLPSIAVASGLVAGSLVVVACGDLFHATDWETLCDHDAGAPGCNVGGGKTTGHTASSSAASGAGGNGGTSASGGGGAGGGPDPCNAYCSEVVDGCMTTDPQYLSQSNCLHICDKIPHIGPAMADDIPCRETYAAKVATDPTACEAAGPGGAGKCGPLCDAYCLLMTIRCPSSINGASQCAMDCMTFDKTTPYSTSVVSGNSFACRLAWAVKAFEDATLCMNAAPDSPVCVDADM
jgi:hypothetical protein